MRIAVLGNPDSIHVQRWVKFLQSSGHTLLLIADPHTRVRPEGLQVEVPEWTPLLNFVAFGFTPRPYGNALWKSRLYRPLIEAFRPDVVHGFEASYNGLATARAGPYPRVLSPWGRDIFFDGQEGFLGAWMMKRALNSVERITCNDESIAPFLVEQYGVRQERIRPFSWGIDLRIFQPADEAFLLELRRDLGLPPESRIIFSPRKWGALWGSDRLVEALPKVLQADASVVVVLMGPGSEGNNRSQGQDLKTRLDTRVDPARIRWLDPNQTPEQMARYYSLSEVFVSVPPRDLLAQTILEGMACHCFPVLSDLPAYAKHARQGETALMVDPLADAGVLADALIRALQDTALREAAVQTNRDAMRRLEDASVNMKQIDEVYAEAIEEHRRGEDARRA